jgi:hypothetical protein
MNTREDASAVSRNKLLDILFQVIREIVHKLFAVSIHESNFTNMFSKFVSLFRYIL